MARMRAILPDAELVGLALQLPRMSPVPPRNRKEQGDREHSDGDVLRRRPIERTPEQAQADPRNKRQQVSPRLARQFTLPRELVPVVLDRLRRRRSSWRRLTVGMAPVPICEVNERRDGE